MPSYRYTRDIKPEELQPEQAAVLTGKAKRQNWWHYHWKIVAAIAAAVLLVAVFVAEIVRKPTPDLNIVLLTSTNVPDPVSELLSEQLGNLVGDVNGDGKAVVEILVCNLDPYTGEEEGENEPLAEEELPGDGEEASFSMEYNDPYTQMAGVTKLVAALDDETSMLFIVETDLLPAFQQAYGILGYLDGSAATGDETDYENMAFAWSSSEVLSALDLGIEYEGGVFDGQEYMEFFSVGVRRLTGTKLAENDKAWDNYSFALQLAEEWQ